MRTPMALLAIALAAGVGAGALAQTTTDQPPAANPTPPPATAPTPAPAPAPATPASPPPSGPKAREFQGLDVFGSDGKQIGKVVKAAELAGGKAGDLEIHSQGFFGFFASVYVVPADKATLKSGRVELSATSDQAKQWVK